MKNGSKKPGVLGFLFKSREISTLIILAFFFIAIGCVNSAYLAPKNLMLILSGSVMYISLAIGMAFVLLIKEVDVSVGATLGLTAAISASMLRDGASLAAVIPVTLLVGLVIGLVNGYGVTAFRVPSIIMTLGTMGVIRGVITIYTGGKWVENVPSYFKNAAEANLFGFLNVFVLCTAAVVVAIHLLISRTARGKHFAAVGDNIEGANMMGIRVDRTRILAFVLSGIYSAVAGLIYVSQVGFVSDIAGNGIEMTTIAGCVIGGVSMSGGVGSIVGAAFGAVFMTSISSALVFLKVPAYWNDTISGAILIVVVVADALLHHYSREKARKQRLLARTQNLGGVVHD